MTKRTYVRSVLTGAALSMLLMLTVSAVPALAGTAAVNDLATVVSYTAAPGETMSVTIQQSPQGSPASLRITDTAAGTMTAGEGCVLEAGAPQALVCTVPWLNLLSVTGTAGSDQIVANVRTVANLDGGDGPDLLVGGSGDDYIKGGAGSDYMIGNGGSDEITTRGCGDLVSAGAGVDRIRLRGGGGVIDGGDGDDFFSVKVADCAAGNDVHGGPGTDSFSAATVDAQDPSGWPVSTPAVVTLDDVADDGPISAEPSNIRADVESFTGGEEDDYILGSDGSNVLNGGGGDDVIDGGLGSDAMSGGEGEDAIDYSSHSQPVTVRLAEETEFHSSGNGHTGEGDSLMSFEHVYGGTGNDVLAGNAGDNVIDGQDGSDAMSGGDGMDVIDYSLRDSRVIADLDGSPGDDGSPGEGDTIASDVEGLIGGAGDDLLTGGASDGIILGGDGDDYIVDAGGQDLLFGAEGDDQISGQDGEADSIVCSEGTDSITADRIDDVDPDCEKVDLPLLDPPVVLFPEVRFTEPSNRTLTTKTVMFTFTVSIPGSTLECWVDLKPLPTCASPISLTLPDGPHSVMVRATSPAGVVGAPAYRALSVDTTRPAITVKLPRARCVGRTGQKCASAPPRRTSLSLRSPSSARSAWSPPIGPNTPCA